MFVPANSFFLIVKKIQNKWKCQVLLDQTRVKILQKAWATKINEMIEMYGKKGKKYRTYVRKLHILDCAKRDLSLMNYYKEAKRKHLIAIGKWMQKRAKLGVVLFHLYFLVITLSSK